MTRDKAKLRAAKIRHREKVKIAKFGPAAAGKDMRGRHGNHARGQQNGRWNAGRLFTSSGYVAVRVEIGHPHGWGPPNLTYRYAYEHVIVLMQKIGRALTEDEVVHHVNGDRHDNRPENLVLLTRSEHAALHARHPSARDDAGRFCEAPRHGDIAEWPEDLRVREFPKSATNRGA